jgi:anti-sigma regulatory factor (Ser/Thr protein kinase)
MAAKYAAKKPIMIKIHILILLFTVAVNACFAQVKWGMDTTQLSNREWSNYSTTYEGPETESITPTIVTAIPYNGIYSHKDEYASPMAMTFDSSLYSFRSYLSKNAEPLYTYDSGNVYFLTPGIHPENVDKYEYRITLNGKTVIAPWSTVKQFTDNSFQLNMFKKHLGFLGGYKTAWGSFILVELRRKGSDISFASALIYWKQARPKFLLIYTPYDVSELLTLLKNKYDPYEPEVQAGDLTKWQKLYPPDQIDPNTHLPKRLVLSPGASNIIFYLTTGIFKKEAVEYELLKNGKVETLWKSNDFDNSFIWIKKLTQGNYLLRLRYSAQRHNITEYSFEVLPAWYQTGVFKAVLFVLIAAFFAAIFLLNRLIKQRKKTEIEQAKKNRLKLELKAIHAQLNPHFIFNALSSIQGLVNNNDIKGANHYLSEFGRLLRNSLTGGDNDFTVLQNEVAVLETYLTLERLRFGFGYRIKVEGSINTSETEIPSLLLQPLAENSVKHGMGGLQQSGMININFIRKGNDMVVTFEDNGKGFSATDTASGYGLKLTRERIALLNEVMKGQSIAFTIKANTGNGTVMELVFRNWLG